MAMIADRPEKLGKDAVAYTLLAFFFISIFVVLFMVLQGVTHQEHSDIIRSRVLSMKNFIDNLHGDIQRAAYISGYRALIALDEFVSSNGEFIASDPELEGYFREAFVNGTINGTSYDVLVNASFGDYIDRVRVQALKSGINVTVEILNVSLEQSSAWDLTVHYNGLFNITDVRGVAWWEYEHNFSTSIPIFGLRDPVYSVNTLGRVPYTITNFSLPAEGFVDSSNDTSVLKQFIEGSYYIESTEAPNYLQRFTGDLSPDEFGIESIVYLPALSDQGLVVNNDSSVVDHIYFSNSGYNDSLDRCSIQNLIYSPDWFRLDEDHLKLYEVENLTYSSCS